VVVNDLQPLVLKMGLGFALLFKGTNTKKRSANPAALYVPPSLKNVKTCQFATWKEDRRWNLGNETVYYTEQYLGWN